MFWFKRQHPRCPAECLLGAEPLESRDLLAGNVTVAAGDTISIIGDEANNAISLVSNGTTVTIAGLKGTTITGPTSVTARPLVLCHSLI